MAPVRSCLSSDKAAYKGLSASINSSVASMGEIAWCAVGWT